MAVIITDLCTSCDSCVEECPATAILSSNETDRGLTYVRPERCIECVDSTAPKCADACPTEGAIAWDMPYTAEYLDHFKSGHERGTYRIKTHKVKGPMFPDVTPKSYRENIPMDYRTSHKPVDIEEMNRLLFQ